MADDNPPVASGATPALPRRADAADTATDNASDGFTRLHPLDLPALALFVLLFFTVVLQFFTRYVLNDSLGWTEEIARYLLIMTGFLGGIVCVRRNSHIQLEFLYSYLPAAAVKPLKICCQLITAVFFLYCGWLAIELAQRTSSNMASIEVPKAVIYYVVCIGAFLMGALAAFTAGKLARSSRQ